ncbi:hypothetical protein [Desulfuribacillus stibiiarsenatis]|uniref:hypothetical protein n=1 Tax=Desulfuribacillus stibiiarsenatis TaxID=1390249 RepID=UPI00159F04E2|nr:hypothetical protein [Desulfuribacillus stibiiarsenatis]
MAFTVNDIKQKEGIQPAVKEILIALIEQNVELQENITALEARVEDLESEGD